VRVRWLRAALVNLDVAGATIAKDNPQAANKTVQRRLAENPQLDISRAGRVPGTRELIVDRAYLVAYRVRGGELQVLRLLHAKQRWPDTLS
jgi:toxin ParE1/3/4